MDKSRLGLSATLRVAALLCLVTHPVTASEAARPTFGRLEDFSQADGVCYVALRTEDGRLLEETAAAPLCGKAKTLRGKRVQLKWGPGHIDSPECAGRKDCKARTQVTLIISATPAGEAHTTTASR